jgi:hypothetical protein
MVKRTGHVFRIGVKRNEYKILVGKTERKSQFWRSRSLRNYAINIYRLWAWFNRLRIGFSEDIL